jgi:predicted Zn-dependent peptidase
MLNFVFITVCFATHKDFIRAHNNHMENYRISENIDYHFIQTDKFKTFTVCVLFRQKITRKDVTKNALLPMVIKRGTFAYPSIKYLSRAVDSLFGASFDVNIVKKGDEQMLCYHLEILDNDPTIIRNGMEFLHEIIYNPLLSEDFIEDEKKNLRKNIADRVNNKADYARLKCIELMFPNNPYGIPADGYDEDIKEITQSDCRNALKKYLENSPIKIMAVGKNSLDFTNLFYKNRNVNRKPIKDTKIKETDSNKPQEHKETIGANQGKISMGFRLQNEIANKKGIQFYSAMVCNELFGGGMSSKLFTTVREKNSLCYSIGSSLYRFMSAIMVGSGADAENLEKIKDMTIQSLVLIQQGEFADEELANAKKGLRKKLNAIKDYPLSLLDFYVSQVLLDDVLDLDSFASGFCDVSKDNVMETAGRAKLDTVYYLI